MLQLALEKLEDGAQAFAYKCQLAFPLPTGIAHKGDTKRQNWLSLGGVHLAHQPDIDQLQRPRRVFSAPVRGHVIEQVFDAEAPRFGDFLIAHYGSGDANLTLHPHLELGNRDLAVALNLFAGPSKERLPDQSLPASHNLLAFKPGEEDATLKVTTRAQAIGKNSGKLAVDLEDQLGKQIKAHRGTVTVETEFSVSATETALRNGAVLSCDAQVRLSFGTDPSTKDDPLSIVQASKWMEAERAGLKETRAQPQSFLPDLRMHGSQPKVDLGARVAVRGRMSQAPGDGLPRIESDPALGVTPPVAVTVLGAGGDTSGNDADTIWLKANFPGVHTGPDGLGDGGAEPHLFHIRLVRDQNALDTPPVRSGFSFRIEDDIDRLEGTHAGDHHRQVLHARLGSLRMRGVTPPAGTGARLFASTPNSKPGTLRLWPDPETGGERHELFLEMNLALSDTRPVTSDLPHGARDRLREDWLIPSQPDDGSETAGSETNFVLETTERLGPEQDHHLQAALSETSLGGARGFDDVLVTRAPFGMMRLRRPPFSALASDASSNVATYDSDTRSWQFRRGDALVPVSFPASSLGESMDKPGRRTITDGADSDSPAVRSRLSGPATLWADTAARGRAFGTPEHNARDLFGQWTEAGPGAELAGFTTELIYGLATAWKRPRNSTALSPIVRIADTGTLMGRTITLADTAADKRGVLQERWSLLTAALASRPQHLEALTADPDGPLGYAPAAFAEGLTFAGRTTAVVAPPVAGMDLSDPADTARGGPKLAAHGLDGGAFWGIEQRAFAEEVLRNPNSTDGTLEGFTLGPFGASGAQEAHFVNGALSIITETRLGRLESVRIEVKGRIGAFYHRAKHVVVYRRTTAESDQFAGIGGPSRRPILRKVEEYIDLQETTRTYPDRPGVDPRSIGPLRELRCASARINVDSAWASDVGPAGWKIPLWNRHAAQIRPAVYPMPSFTAACQGEDTERLTLQELCDPGKLCFYTNLDYAKAEQNTALWPAVHGIDGLDAGDMDRWMRLQDAASAKGANVSTQRRPAASRFIPGAGAFTHCLAPSAALTCINHARGDQPVFAALESVTFLRGGGRKPAHGKGDAASGDAVITELLTSPQALDEALNVGVGPSPDPAFDLPALKALKTVWDDIEDKVKKAKDADVKGIVDTAKTQLDAAADKIENLADAELDRLKKELLGDKLAEVKAKFAEGKKAYALFKKILDADKADCEALQDQARTAIKAKKALLLQRLTGAEGELMAALDKPEAKETELLKRLDELRAEAKGIATETVQKIDADIGNITAHVTDAKALVTDWGDDLDRAYRTGLERISQFKNSYDTQKPWSASRLDKAHKAFETQLANLSAEAGTALSQTRQRLAAEIPGRASDVTSVIDKTLREAVGALDGGNPVPKIAPLILTANQTAFDALQQAAASDEVTALVQRLATAIGDPSLTQAQKTALTAVNAELEMIATRASDLAEKAAQFSTEQTDSIKVELTELANQAKAQVATIAADAAGAVTKLEQGLQDDLRLLTNALQNHSGDVLTAAREAIENKGKLFDRMVDQADVWVRDRAAKLHTHVSAAQSAAETWLGGVADRVAKAQQDLTEGLEDGLKDDVIDPVFDAVKAKLEQIQDPIEKGRAEAVRAIGSLTGALTDKLDQLEDVAGQITSQLTKLCEALVARKDALLKALDGFKSWAADRIKAYAAKLAEFAGNTAAALQEHLKDLGSLFATLTDNVADLTGSLLTGVVRTAEQAASVVADIGQELADGIGRLVAAGAKIPDIGNLGLNTDRITAFFKDLLDDIDVSRVFSSMGGFGDGLGGFSFDLPVIGLGNGFDLPDLNLPDIDFPDLGFGKMNFEDLLPKIAGINFKDIIPDFGRAGNSLSDLSKYVKVTHDIDKKAKTAWAKAELDIDFPKRAKLFGFGPFTLFMNKPDLIAWVRIEASAKTKHVTTTEHGEIKSDLEAVVAGQQMVTLRDVKILYTKDGGLDFDIDPQKIRLNPNFKFIQDIIERLGLGDDEGAFKLIKDGNIPVGIQHKISFPVPPINAGTSGLVGLTIANAFKLKAYPDFLISNQFNLSSQEKPFIFSIFIIGGTGFIQLDVDHLPADKRTTIVVTAGVGGSASLAFAFGPISGGVFITLSVILTYRKYIGYDPADKPADAGLSVALELAILGQVSLWGLATIFLRLSLSMTYHDSGRIDATGRLKVQLRISRFFKLKYSTTVTYKMRDGKSVTTREEDLKVEIPKQTKDRSKKLKKARAKL